MKTFKKTIISTFAVLGLLLTATQPATAHVTAQLYGSTPTANAYGFAFFRVPHADVNKSTVKVEIQIPEGVTAVKPQQIAGWNETVTYKEDGKTPSTVIWQGGNLPDTSFADFGISMKYPNTPGVTIYFKTIQTLNDGSLVSWIEVPTEGVNPHSLAKPAPSIQIAKTEQSAGHGSSGMDQNTEASINGTSTLKSGKLTINITLTDKTLAGSEYALFLVGSKDHTHTAILKGKLTTNLKISKTLLTTKNKLIKNVKSGDQLHVVAAGKMQGKITVK